MRYELPTRSRSRREAEREAMTLVVFDGCGESPIVLAVSESRLRIRWRALRAGRSSFRPVTLTRLDGRNVVVNWDRVATLVGAKR